MLRRQGNEVGHDFMATLDRVTKVSLKRWHERSGLNDRKK